MEIKAIETVYNGYRFRSRLEARWAVFFDAANIEYQYEPEGFIGWCDKPYLPDFYLPQFKVYVEVKGTDEDLYSCSAKIGECIDYGATDISYKGLLLLGDIPYKLWHFPYFPILTWYKGVVVHTALFDIWEDKPSLYRSDLCNLEYLYFNGARLPQIEWAIEAERIPKGISVSPKYISESHSGCYSASSHINECYQKARQARFEHGEMPTTK